MPATALKVNKVGETELAMERTFEAPRDLVWRAWTEAEHLLQWWGPKDYPTTYCKVDLRVGGVWHYCMTGPGGDEAWAKATYREIAAPERLAYTDAFSDKDGNEYPPISEVRMTFIDQGNKTLMQGTTVFASAADRDKVIEMGIEEGMASSLERLDEHLKTLT